MSNWRATGELLDEAEKLDLFPVGEYRTELPAWGKMVLSFPYGWGATHAFDPNSLRLLSTLGPQLRPLVPPLDPSSAETFEQALDQVLATLQADTSINGDVGRYLIGLVLHMRLVIEEYRLDIRGDYDLARAATLLKTTIDTAYASSTSEETKPRWAWLREIFTLKNATQLAIEWGPVWAALMSLPSGNS